MTETYTLEIIEAVQLLPAEKVVELHDFALFLRERYGKTATIDESDEWTDEDLRDFSVSSMSYADKLDEAKSGQEKTPAEILAEIAALPMAGNGEKFSNRDHDRILYGKANEK